MDVTTRIERALTQAVGSAEEAGLCEDVSNIMKQANPALPVLNAAGAVSLIETAALMDRCAVVLTNDSGLMHIAAARGRSLVAVFGPTVRQFGFFPTGSRAVVVEHPNLDCRPCTPIGLPSCPQGHFRCMNEIPAARVTEAARALMARSAV